MESRDLSSPLITESEDQIRAMSVLEAHRDSLAGPSGDSSGSYQPDPALSQFATDSLNKRQPGITPGTMDLEHRIHKANEDLAKQPDVSEERETRIKFKEDLIEVVGPGTEGGDEDDESVKSPARVEEDEAPVEENNSEKKEKVLIEKEGKFELLDENDVKGENSKKNGGSSLEDLLGLSPAEPQSNPERADDTAKSNEQSPKLDQPSPPPQRERPTSAPNKRINYDFYQGNDRAKSANRDKSHNGHRTPEMIEEAKERARQKRKEDAERKEKEEAEKARIEKENRDAFEAWKQEKQEQQRKERQREREKKQQANDCEDDKQKKEKAYEEWLKVKARQDKEQKLLERLKREEEQQWVVTRSKQDCRKAYRRWLKQKRIEEEEERMMMTGGTRAMMSKSASFRKSRKSAQIAQAIKMAEQFKFIDHYGYRF